MSQPNRLSRLLRIARFLVALFLLVGIGSVAEGSSSEGDVPAGMVTFFETETCPAGWTQPEYARGRLLMFDGKNGSANPVGTPMAAGVAPQHVHAPLSVSFDLPRQEVKGENGCGNTAPVAVGKRNIANYSGITASDLNLPFIHLIACEKTGKDAPRDPLPIETYGFFNRDSCPSQWEVCGPPVCPPITGRFAMPLVAGGTTGLVTGDGWTGTRQDGNHEHRVAGAFTPTAYGVAWFLFPSRERAASGERKFEGDSGDLRRSQPGDLLPYVRLLGCIKTGLVADAADPLPEGMTIFHGGQSNCPSGWRPTPETAGRRASIGAGLDGPRVSSTSCWRCCRRRCRAAPPDGAGQQHVGQHHQRGVHG